MNIRIVMLVSIIVIFSMMSCTSSYESKGDKAYNAAQRASSDLQRKLRKEAYIYYQKAIAENPKTVSTKLKNRFIEMTLYRAEMVINEGSVSMDALPLYTKDIDNMLSPDVNPELKERYAQFLKYTADSSFSKRKLYQGLNYLDKAIKIANNKSPFQKQKQEIIDNFAKENFEAAEIEMINGITNKDAESLVRAEFMVQVALMFDNKFPGATEMLSKLRQENIGTYSAYDAVVFDKPDSNIYDKVNKYDILLAVPKFSSSYMEVDMYNYSCNPQRLAAKNFFLVDTRGKKYPALKSSKFDKDFIDQEHEAKLKLRFRKPSAKIKKLAFQSDDGDHYTEKVFF